MLKRFTEHLFYKIGLLVVLFSILLTAVIFYTVDYYYVEQDTLLDAHELYFYGKIIDSWDFPDDSVTIKHEIDNLNFLVSFYNQDSSLVWSYPQIVNPSGYWSYADSDDMQNLHGVENPIFISIGSSDNNEYLTYAKKDSLHIFIGVNQETSPEYINYFPPIIVSIIFMIIFNIFIRRFFRPINWMNERIDKLRDGDMQSEIMIVSNDELAELSKSINKMIKDIKMLLSQKQQLLLDVSHELRSPLARMRLLVELMPTHENKNSMIDEIIFLEGMISNLLFSDKLSLPYSNLEYSQFTISNLLITTIDLINEDLNKFDIKNDIPDLKIIADKTKLIIALRNLIDNAIKYGDAKEPIKIYIRKKKECCIINITNSGYKLNQEEINNLFTPFYRSKRVKNNTPGFGLGLTICKKIIEAHSGKLILLTNINEIQFSIEIPINKK